VCVCVCVSVSASVCVYVSACVCEDVSLVSGGRAYAFLFFSCMADMHDCT
jgi:hypothetical protein